jgi:hypothetical protein
MFSISSSVIGWMGPFGQAGIDAGGATREDMDLLRRSDTDPVIRDTSTLRPGRTFR